MYVPYLLELDSNAQQSGDFMSTQTVSIIGLGWLGLPLAKHMSAKGFAVKGSVTTTEKVITLVQQGIETYLLQLNPEPVGNLNDLLQADTLIVNIPPKAGKQGDAFYPQQIQHLTDAIRQSPIKHVIYISSTSVYPEASRIVTEDEVTTPERSAAPALIQAEQFIQALEPERMVTIVRCGGLMGYNRIPGKYVAGRTVDSGEVPVNYIHRDDVIGIITSLTQHPVDGTFNAVAPEHPTREAIYRKSCADFGYQLPTFVSPVEPVPYKMVSVAKLLQAINYTFKYPNPLEFSYTEVDA